MNIIEKIKRVKDKRSPRSLTVKSAFNLTPNMRRVTLQGDALSDFPLHSEGAYIKLLFESPKQKKPSMRTYTVVGQRSELNEIDVDFMLHTSADEAEHGVAAVWSLNAQPGDTLSIMGPGPAKFINLDAQYFLLAADMTALPALTANLTSLPDSACGQAFIEILSESDKQTLQKPENVEIVWVINSAPGSDASPLFEAIKQADWQDARLAAWVACEFKTMKKIRHYLKVERSIDKSHLYASSYWKKGNTEEQHKAIKQADTGE